MDSGLKFYIITDFWFIHLSVKLRKPCMRGVYRQLCLGFSDAVFYCGFNVLSSQELEKHHEWVMLERFYDFFYLTLNKINIKRKEEKATVKLLWTRNSVMASKLLTCFIWAAISTTATRSEAYHLPDDMLLKYHFIWSSPRPVSDRAVMTARYPNSYPEFSSYEIAWVAVIDKVLRIQEPTSRKEASLY